MKTYEYKTDTSANQSETKEQGTSTLGPVQVPTVDN